MTEPSADFTGTGTLPVPALFAGGGDYDAGAGTASDIRPLETVTFTAAYTITQADINAGTVDNQALASGTNPSGGPVSDISDFGSPNAGQDSPTATPLVGVPKLELEKTSSFVDVNGNGRADAGDRIDYTFAVTNTGAVTLTNITVTDPLPNISVSGTIASLEPGVTNSTAITGSYTLTQADINLGQVENVATASGNPPSGPPVTDESDDPLNGSDVPDGDNDPGDPTVLLLPAVPELTLDKRLAAGSPSPVTAAGQVLNYEFVITNTGNITAPGPFSITDSKITTPITCPAGALAPAASVTCTGSYTVTQQDLNGGSISNTATAQDNSPSSPFPPSDPDTEITPVTASPALTLDKSTTQDQPTDFVQGNVITYTYTVTNSGNVAITAPITVSDNLISSVTCPALPVGGLAPLASLVCTGTYTVTAGDIAQTQVTNTASATDGTTTSNTDSVTLPQGATPALSIEKSLLSVNGAAGTAFANVGDTLVYQYVVRNTGNASYAADVVVNDDKIPGALVCFNSVGGTQSFPPYSVDAINGEVTCTSAAYTVTQADVNANKVDNTATASSVVGLGTPNEATITSAPDTVSVPGTPSNALSVVKTANPPAGAAVGNTITYTIVTTNTGNQTLNPVVVSDPKVPALTCDVAAPISLAPGAFVTCTGPYVVTQADVDAELIENTATASGTPPNGAPPISNTGEVDYIPAAPNNSMTLAKSGAFNDANMNGLADLGETISYSFAVTNTGNQTLFDLAVNDPLLTPNLVGTIASLAPGASQTLTATYPITQANIDAGAGELDNTASLDANDPDGVPIAQVSDDATVTLNRAPEIEVEKTGVLVDTNNNGRDDAGDTINYTFTVRNTGNVTLTGITLADTSFPGIVMAGGPIASLAPNAVDTATFTASYVVQQAALNGDFAAPGDDETIRNEVTATGTYQGPLGPLTTTDTDIEDVSFTPAPSVEIIKTADTSALSTPPQAGDVITYTFEVRNTGSVTLSNVTVTDLNPAIVFNGAPVAPIATLLPGQVDNTTYSASYTLTIDDFDLEKVVNTASVSALPPNSVTPITDTDQVETPIDSTASMEVRKTIDASTSLSSPPQAGDTVQYAIVVVNTGNKRLSNVTVSDPLLGMVDVAVGTLDPGATSTLPLANIPPYTLTQADVNNGFVENQATGEGEANDPANPGTPFVITDASDDPTNPANDDPNADGNPDDPTRLPLTQVDRLSLVKTGSFVDANTNGRADVGEQVNYAFTVKNEGNTTISNITLDDPLAGIVLSGGPIAQLLPGQTDATTFTGSVVLTQAMITAGQVDNRATVTGEDPDGNPVEDESHPTSPADGDNADTTVTLPQQPRIGLVKRGTFVDTNGNGAANVGETVSYTFTVTNTGNVPVTDITVTDSGLPGVTVSGGPISLAPGASDTTTFTASYTLTQNDIDAGKVDNLAQVEGTGPDGIAGTVTDDSHPSSAADGSDDDTTVTLPQKPALTLAKTPTPLSLDPLNFIAGNTLTYDFVVTNSGNITINLPLTVFDNVIGEIPCGAASGTVPPGGTVTCSATYTITSNDTALGSVNNNAFAANPQAQSPTVNALVPTGAAPALTTEKVLLSVNGDTSETQFSQVGDVLRFQYTVTNTGNGVFASDVFVTDNKIAAASGDILCHEYAVLGDFNPQASGNAPFTAVCEAEYIVGQNDLDDTEVTNEAFASSVFEPASANPINVQSPVDTVTVDADFTPSINLVKTSSPASGAAVGETITYSLVATNTGNQTLNDVTISDPKLSALTCDAAMPGSLTPGGTLTCTGTYVVTQADVDNEIIENQASVTSLSPQGTPVNDVADYDHIPQAQDPELTLTKTAAPYTDANGNGRPDAGEVITYTIVVENTGNQTIDNVEVSDPNLTPSTVATGLTLAPGDTRTYNRDYTITLADLNATTGDKSNTASVQGDDPDGDPITDDDTATTPLPREPELTVAKTGQFREVVQPGRQNAGDAIDYTITVTNTGNVTVTSIAVQDPLLGGLLTTIASLAPGASQDVTGSYTLLQSDLNNAERENTATAAGTGSDGTALVPVTADDDVTVPLTQAPAIALVKTAMFNDVDGSDAASTGDTVTYTYTVTNTGNVTAFGVSVAEDAAEFTGTGTLPSPTYVSGGSNPAGNAVDIDPAATATWTATYALTAADIAAGTLDNQAEAEGLDPNGDSVSDLSDESGTGAGDDDPTTVTYNRAPKAEDDLSTGNAIGSPVTINPLVDNGSGADGDDDGPLDPTSVRLLDAGGNPVTSLVVSGEGTWTVNTATGAITFTPEAGFTTDPTPVDYIVADQDGAYSPPASVTIEYTAAPQATPNTSQNNAIGAPVSVTLLTDDSVDTGRTVDAASVQLTLTGAPANAVLSPDGKTLTVPGQGDWTVQPDGSAIFTPEAGFTTNPTPVNYTFADDQGNRSNEALITVTYTAAPVATPNTSTGNAIGAPVTVTLLGDDTVDAASGRTVDAASVQLTLTGAPAGAVLSPDGKTLTVPGQGVWTVQPDGTAIFTPEAGFTTNPTPVSYTFADDQGNRSNEALITVTYTEPPEATDNADTYLPGPGAFVTIDVVGDDSAATGRSLDPTSVLIIDPATGLGVTTLTVAGEGVWTVDAATGAITFTPENGFATDPTPIGYTVADDQGNRSNEATVTVTSLGLPAVSLETSVASTEDTNGDGVLGEGDKVLWKFRITNTGNIPLTQASITENDVSLNMPGLVCRMPAEFSPPNPGLQPGQSVDLDCVNADYVLTAGDVKAGRITLEATVTANGVAGAAVKSDDPAAVLEFNAGSVEIFKSSSLANVRAGQLVPYTIRVVNTRSRLCQPVPDVCIDERRLPLFIARATLRELIAGLEARATGDAAR
ncbi:MAG: hypothetical protein U5N55_13850 [Cypionkella sp.]|nr:hypothetical protein [Cypionkella sp.]